MFRLPECETASPGRGGRLDGLPKDILKGRPRLGMSWRDFAKGACSSGGDRGRHQARAFSWETARSFHHTRIRGEIRRRG